MLWLGLMFVYQANIFFGQEFYRQKKRLTFLKSCPAKGL